MAAKALCPGTGRCSSVGLGFSVIPVFLVVGIKTRHLSSEVGTPFHAVDGAMYCRAQVTHPVTGCDRMSDEQVRAEVCAKQSKV